MSTLTYLTSLVQQAISRLNLIETNAKKVDELPHQTTLEPTSKIPVSRAGISEHLTVQQVISSIQNSNYNQLLAVGTITVDGTDIIVASGVSGQINGALYGTSTDTTIPIALCDAGFNRKDILVLTTSNTVIAISGEETDGAIVLAPPVPTDALYITEFDVNDTAIGTPSDPVLGAQFIKKTDNSSYSISPSGANVALEIPANGASMLFLTNAALVSVSGFSLVNITGNPAAEVPYNGKPFFIVNNTGVSVTLNHDETADVPFMFVAFADIVMPPSGIIELRYVADGISEVFKSWSEVDLSTKQDKLTETNLGEFIDGLDSKTDIKDVDKFIISDSEDSLKSKKTRFLDLKQKLKSFFDNIYTTSSAVASQISTALVGYASQSWVIRQGYITNVISALGFTPENVANKATNLNSPSNTTYPSTQAVVNENKKATITVELINQLTTDFYAPNALRINSTALISGSGTLTLKVNDIAYTLGNLIPQGAKITAYTTSSSVYNLISIYE